MTRRDLLIGIVLAIVIFTIVFTIPKLLLGD